MPSVVCGFSDAAEHVRVAVRMPAPTLARLRQGGVAEKQQAKADLLGSKYFRQEDVWRLCNRSSSAWSGSSSVVIASAPTILSSQRIGPILCCCRCHAFQLYQVSWNSDTCATSLRRRKR